MHRLNSIIKSKIKSTVHGHRMEISMNMDERCDACTYFAHDRKPSIIFDLSE